MSAAGTNYRFTGRVLAFLLAIALLLTSVPYTLISVFAADDEFHISLSWNHDPENPDNTVYDSDSPENKDVRLKIQFSNGQVSKRYEPGELVITVTGMKDAVRSGNSYIPVGIAADKEDAVNKKYNWSYSYTEATDTYTFYNNFVVEDRSVFEGSLEIIWTLPSRETKHEYKKDFTAELYVDGKSIESEPVSYSQTRKKDTYTLDGEASKVFEDRMPATSSKPDDYIWVKYDFEGHDTSLARGVKDNERYECWFPEDAEVFYGDLIPTADTQEIDGKIYKKYTSTKDKVSDVFVAYPRKKYEGEVMNVYSYLYGTYYEESDETELANCVVTTTLKDYGYDDIPGPVYKVDKQSYGEHNMTIDQNHKAYGAVKAPDLSSGGGEYYSDMQLFLDFYAKYDGTDDPIDVDYYDLEFVDDILDIQLKDGSIRRLNDDEYHFTKIRIPPVTEICNSNGLPIAADAYEVEIYGRAKDTPETGLDAFDVNLSPDKTLMIGNTEQFIEFERDDIVGVRIFIKGIKESLSKSPTIKSALARCYYVFDISEDEIEKIVTDEGKLFNNMFFNLYRTYSAGGIENEWFNKGFGEDKYLGSDAKDKYEHDVSVYKSGLDRNKSDTPIVEETNEFNLESTTIVQTESDANNYYFEGSMTGKFVLGEDTLLRKFSMHTIVPKGLRLEEICKDPEELLSRLSFESSADLPSSYLASHVKIEIVEDPKYDGRQYIAFNFDFGDEPIDVGTVTISGIPMYISKKDITGGTHSYTMNGALLVDQEGKWNSETTDNNLIEGGIWKDIDNDGDTDEKASFRSGSTSFVHSEETLVSLVKYVSTPFINGQVNPPADEATAENAPKTYIGGDYSYRLKATVNTTTGGGGATHIIFADVIESQKNKTEWQGEFVGIDYSQALAQLDYPGGEKPVPIIYYSTEEVTFTQKESVDSDGNTVYHNDFDSDTFKDSSVWTTEKPKDNKDIRAIAIDFGEGIASPSKVLWVEIQMKAPEDTKNIGKIAKNQCSVTYDKLNGVDATTEHQGLDSNVVPVTYVQKGRIILNKLDSDSSNSIAGAQFKLYRKAQEPDTEDTLVKEYTVGKNGKLIISDLDFGEYYFIETKAPKGYHLSTDPEKNKSSTIILTPEQPEVTVEMRNERDPGTFSIKKVSDRNPNVALQGAEFALYKSNGEFVSDGHTTGAGGMLTLENLEWGSYYLKETKAPAGYKLSDEKIEFTINAANDAGKELETVQVKNEQLPAKVKLVKYELTDPYTEMSSSPIINNKAPVKGAMYTLYDDKGNKITTKITDANGEIYVEDLTFGTYYFEETMAATGYKKYGGKLYFNVGAEHTAASVYKIVETADTRLTGSIHLSKTDDSGDVIHPAKPIDGAVYRMYNKSDTKFSSPLKFTNNGNGKYTYSPGSDTTDLVTFGPAEGFFDIDGLHWGDYVLKEYKAPNGYALSEKKFEFTIGRDNVGMGTQVFSDIDNRINGSVKLKKVSLADKTALANAIFTLYRDDGSVYKDDITTGADGTVKVENIPWGSYYFLEKTAPAGYGLNDQKFKFTVNELTAGDEQVITVKDPVENYQFTVTKKIKKSDIVFEHGNPTFIFEVKKTDDGHIYRKMLSFSEDTAADEDGYVKASVVFIVPQGSYEISEVSVSRYKLKEITCTDSTSKFDSAAGKATFEVGADNNNFTFTFENEKSDQTGTSDNGSVTNTLNRSRALIGIAAEYIGPDIVTEDVIPPEDVEVYALYDNGTKEKLESWYTLSPVDSSKPNTEQSITVTYEKDGEEFTDTVTVQIGNLNLFTYEVIEGYEAGYSAGIIITGYKGKSSVVNFPAVLIDTKNGSEMTYKVKQVGNGSTLTGMDAVTTITFAEGIEKIGNSAFSDQAQINCPINIPESVTSIGDSAFAGTHITGLTFNGNNLTEIGASAFYNGLWEDNYENYLNCELTLPASLQKIGNDAFRRSKIKSITFSGNNLTEIGSSAFGWCSNLSGDLYIPDSVEKIGNRAFSCCEKFNGTLHLPNNHKLESIDMNTFFNCPFIGTLEIPASVKKIGYGAFGGDDGKAGQYTQLILHDGLEEISVTTEGTYNYENHGSFHNCKQLSGELKIPSTVKTIGQGAFQNCSGFTGNLIIPDNVKTIGQDAFNTCTGFDGKLKVSRNVETIGNYAFRACKFSEIEVVSSKLTTLGTYAFWLDFSPTGNVIIPLNANVGKGAAYNCSTANIYYPQSLEGNSDAKFGIEGKVNFYTDYTDLKQQLGAKAAELGVDTWT